MLAPVRGALTHAVVVVRQLEAREAEAVVGAHCVFTGAVTARLPVALVDVWNNQGKGVTVALQRSPSGSQRGPLTHAHALIRSGLEAVVAETAIAALGVDTLAVAAHVRDVLALVPI